MTTASNVLQELMSMVEDVKMNADYAKSDIEDKQSRLEDIHTEIEDGLSAILGFDYKINEKKANSQTEKLSLSIGQVFNYKENFDMPSKSSLDQKVSDVVGTLNYNFGNITLEK